MNTIVSIVAKALVAGLSLALIAAPVAAQAADADLTVTIASLTGGNTADGEIAIGELKTYVVEIANAGPSTATDVALARPSLDPKLTIVQVRGCVLTAVGGVIDPTLPAAWPCAVGSIQDGTSAFVEFDVQYTTDSTVVPAIPADYPKHLPTVCPATDAAFALTPTTVSVTSTTIDPTLPNEASVTDVPAAIADVKVDITLPAAGNPGSFQLGQEANITVTVTNAGPCPASDVWVNDLDGTSAYVPPPPWTPVGTSTLGTWVFVSSSGEADALTAGCEAIWDGCAFGDLAVAQSKTQDFIYTPQPMPDNDLMQTAYPFSLNVASGMYTGIFSDIVTLDPIQGDNKKTVKNIVSKDVSACSTGGVPGALGLLLVGMAALRRRRS